MDYEKVKALLSDVEFREDARVTGNGDLLDAAEILMVRCHRHEDDLCHLSKMVAEAFHEGYTTPVLDPEAWDLSSVKTKLYSFLKLREIGEP